MDLAPRELLNQSGGCNVSKLPHGHGLPSGSHVAGDISGSAPSVRIHASTTEEPISVAACMASVGDDTAGAISLFVGTTRNHHGGKAVVHLEYEAHGSMAVKEMERICSEAHERCIHALTAAHVVHRLGVVPVGEASIVIATSSPHRAEAMAATEYIINQVKARVPVWKREVYGDGTSSWKENCECGAPRAP